MWKETLEHDLLKLKESEVKMIWFLETHWIRINNYVEELETRFKIVIWCSPDELEHNFDVEEFLYILLNGVLLEVEHPHFLL